MLFNAISPLNGGGLDDYYKDWQYPLDLNGSLDFTRPATGVSVFPYPVMIGAINGFLPQFNLQEWALWGGKLPTGPWIGSGQGDLNTVFPNLSGGMQKVKG